MERNDKKAQKMKREDEALQKAIYWILGAVVLELALLLLNRYYIDYKASEIDLMLGIHSALGILSAVFPVCCLASLFCWVRNRKAGKSAGVPQALTMVTAVLSACVIVLRFFNGGRAVKALYIAVPVVAVLAIIYYLYQHEFFANAVLCAAGLLGLWMGQRAGGHAVVVYGYLVVLAVVLVAVVLACRKMSRAGGVLAVGGKERQIFPKSANYVLTYVTCGVVAVDVIASLALAAVLAPMALYGVLVAWLLVMAVYYTVGLM